MTSRTARRPRKRSSTLPSTIRLTKLPNRQLLLDRLHEALSDNDRPREGALMFIDLDNFKVLNDTLGHQKGDQLLQQVAERLRSCVARGDTVARLGGDEFVILLENTGHKPLEPAAGARTVSERILAKLGEPYVLSGHLHHSTCSIGVTLVRAGALVGERTAQAGRPGHVPGQERRPQHRVLLRSRDAGGGDGQCRAGYRSAAGLARRPVPDRLPAPGGRRRVHDRGRGVAALAAIRSARWCRRRISSRQPRKPRSSSRSGAGCWSKPVPSSPNGPSTRSEAISALP